MSDLDSSSEVHDAASFVQSAWAYKLMPSSKRRGVVARWVLAKLEHKTDEEAKREAVAGMSFLTALLAHIIVKLLIKWWGTRDK